MSLSSDLLYNLIGSRIFSLVQKKSIFSNKKILRFWDIDEERPILPLDDEGFESDITDIGRV